MRLSEGDFRGLVERVIEELPHRVLRHLDNVDVVVEPLPPDALESRGGMILGLYQGVPRNRRSVMGLRLPDKITLFQRNLERICSTRQQLVREIRRTLLHEIGHHFGMNERELHDSGY